MELAAHSMHYPDLMAVGDGVLADEFATSRARSEAITGERCRVMAYPFDAHDGRVREAADRAGYELAFTYSQGP